MPTPAQYLHLRQLIEDRQHKRIAEVGVWKGHFSIHILENCPQVEKVYSIDPYRQWPKKQYVDSRNNTSQKKFEHIHQRVQGTLSKFGDRSTLIRDTSLNAVKTIKDESLDLVWIDANHSYQCVKEDMHAWLPKVKHGGILSGDDYGLQFPGTIEAVNEYCFVRDIIVSVIPGGVWYFEKGKVYLRGGRDR